MNRVIKFFVVSLAMMLFATAAFAQSANQRIDGMKGIGCFSPVGSSVPDIIGVRYWMNDGMAIDFGVGIAFENNQIDPADTAPDASTESLFDFAFDIGLPFVMHGEENMIVYFRPGVTVGGVQGFDSSTTEIGDKGYDIAFRGELALGGEFFLGNFGWPNLSFSGQIGLGIDVVSPKEDGSDTDVAFTTNVRDVSITESGSLGFHIYF